MFPLGGQLAKPWAMFLFFGTKFWTWGSTLTPDVHTCARCGFRGQFVEKKGMTFFTLYFFIPLFPVSGVKQLMQCPSCKARYALQTPGSNAAQPPISNPWS